jgi:T5SS/PEP-CTERM-associated repeat protein
MTMSVEKKAPLTVCAIVASTLWLLLCTAPAIATITATGDIAPAYDGTDLWYVGGYLRIGIATNGTLDIMDGGRVVSSRGYIAAGAGSTASVQVTGAGSGWDISGDLFVGDSGSGTLTVCDGASLMTWETVVGSEVGSVGHLIVTGPGTT